MDMPEAAMSKILKDSLGRTIDYLRISVTDRCSLRCIYCMPEVPGSPPAFLPEEELLTTEEWLGFARAAAMAGIRKIRLTGGEPLMRRDLPEMVRSISALPQVEQVVMTTNGVGLARNIDKLKAAGLSGVNVSLDSLDSGCYRQIAGSDRMEEALEGIRACLALGLPVKINCVPVRGINDSQWIPLAALAKEWPVQVRFIEMMPIGGGKAFPPVENSRIRELLEQEFGPMTPAPAGKRQGPAQVWKVHGFAGSVGFISAVSCGCCSTCNRIRATADGKIKLCLHHPANGDVRGLLRMGKGPEEICRWLQALVLEKPGDGARTDESRPMWKIGG